MINKNLLKIITKKIYVYYAAGIIIIFLLVLFIWFFISGGNINFLSSNNVKDLKEIIVYVDKRRIDVNHNIFRAKVLYNLVILRADDVDDCENIEIPEIFFNLKIVGNRTEMPFVHMREGDITIRCLENINKSVTFKLV